MWPLRVPSQFYDSSFQEVTPVLHIFLPKYWYAPLMRFS